MDAAKRANPDSRTLADFRADPRIVQAEQDALAAAGRLVTPHRALAQYLGGKAWLLDWHMPDPIERRPSKRSILFFPYSRLARKGGFELEKALDGRADWQVCYLGSAEEGVPGCLDDPRHCQGSIEDLAEANVVVAPAWIEHQPRILLRALASGIPVIATEACGLAGLPGVIVIERPDALALRDALERVIDG